jgi:putative chitinase
VQLTWQGNYASLGQALGLGDDLLINPDNALVPQTAYSILSFGMRNGSFSTAQHQLSDYIDGNGCDYKNARQIINLHDQDVKIAGYATDIEMLLRVSCDHSISDSTF